MHIKIKSRVIGRENRIRKLGTRWFGGVLAFFAPPTRSENYPSALSQFCCIIEQKNLN